MFSRGSSFCHWANCFIPCKAASWWEIITKTLEPSGPQLTTAGRAANLRLMLGVGRKLGARFLSLFCGVLFLWKYIFLGHSKISLGLFQNGETLCSKLRPKSSFYPVIGSQYANRVESGAAFALFLLVAISNRLECLTEIMWWGEGRKESRKREGNCQ